MSDIQFYNTTVAGTTSALSTGELAVNIADRSLMIGNSAGTAVRLNAFKWISSTRYDTTTSNISVPAGALFLEIIGCGGGGGGGGGASVRSTNVATQPNSQGGAGGGGGQGGRFLFSIKELGITSGVSTVQVNIGAGGAGGVSSNSGSNVGGSGVDGNQTWVQRTGEGITQAFVIFPGGKAGAGGGRGTAGLYNVPVETTADILDGILGEYNPSFPDDPIEYWGGEGRGGQAIGGNTGVSYLYGPDAFSGLYGGGGGGGGGGGYVFVTGGITYGVATSGGRAGTGGAFINTARTGTGGVPTGTSSSAASEGVQGTYGGAGGAGGGGGWTYGQSGRGGTGGPGGGGGGGGGGQRHYDAGSATSSGTGGRGGSGYVILRWW